MCHQHQTVAAEVYKTHTSRPDTRSNPQKHQPSWKYRRVWRDRGAAVYTSATLGLKMRHECATVCCRAPLNRINLFPVQGLNEKAYVSVLVRKLMIQQQRWWPTVYYKLHNLTDEGTEYLFRDQKSIRGQCCGSWSGYCLCISFSFYGLYVT